VSQESNSPITRSTAIWPTEDDLSSVSHRHSPVKESGPVATRSGNAGTGTSRPGARPGCEADDDVVVGEVSVQRQDLDHPVPAAAGPKDSVSR
jgi:hypothetical protein